MDIDTYTYKDRIIGEYADLECKKICKKIIDRLRKMDSVVCNERFDDLECENVWNAICVRTWIADVWNFDPYEGYSYKIFTELLQDIPDYVKSAIWCACIDQDFSAFDDKEFEYEREYQTLPDGSKCIEYEGIVDIKGFPYVIDDMFHYIWSNYILKIAEDYSNKVIRREKDLRERYDMDD